MHRVSRSAAVMFAGVVALAGAMPIYAQDKFPSKPVRIVIPFAAGSAAAILAREVGHGDSVFIKASISL